jgi:hypothetical protein
MSKQEFLGQVIQTFFKRGTLQVIVLPFGIFLFTKSASIICVALLASLLILVLPLKY